MHVLVEKPMATSLAEADEMIAAGRGVGRHAGGRATPSASTRRFRPRCRCCGTPRFIEVHRLSGFPERSLDIDVIFDVMIHDLDIMLAMDRAEVTGVEAVGVPVLTSRSRHRERAREVRVRAASRTSRPAASAATRCARCGASSRTCTCRSTTARRSSRCGGCSRGPGDRPAIEGGPVAGRSSDEPLRRELADFVEAIRERPRAARHRCRMAAARWRWRRASPRRSPAHANTPAASERSASSEHVSGHQRLHRRARSPQGSGAHHRAGQPEPRDRGRHRPRLQVARRRARAAVRAADRRDDAGRGESVRIDVAHLPRARRRVARRPGARDRRADDAADAEGLHGRPEDDAARQPADRSDAEDRQGRAVSGSRQDRRRARRAADPEDLAGGRRAVHHAAAGHHPRSRNRHAQHRHLPHAGLRPPHDRHALAAPQGRRAAPSHRRAARQAARGGRGARRRSGAAATPRPRRCPKGSTS